MPKVVFLKRPIIKPITIFKTNQGNKGAKTPILTLEIKKETSLQILQIFQKQ